jgi:hypothetical protein
MTSPCTCDRYHSRFYTTDQCRLCWLYHHDPAYRALWDGYTPPVPHIARLCKHRAEVVGMVHCPTCTGRVHLKVFTCLVHGQCTTDTALPAVVCCKECHDYECA